MAENVNISIVNNVNDSFDCWSNNLRRMKLFIPFTSQKFTFIKHLEFSSLCCFIQTTYVHMLTDKNIYVAVLWDIPSSIDLECKLCEWGLIYEDHAFLFNFLGRKEWAHPNSISRLKSFWMEGKICTKVFELLSLKNNLILCCCKWSVS